MKPKKNPEAVVREIKRQTRRKFSAEEKIRSRVQICAYLVMYCMGVLGN